MPEAAITTSASRKILFEKNTNKIKSYLLEMQSAIYHVHCVHESYYKKSVIVAFFTVVKEILSFKVGNNFLLNRCFHAYPQTQPIHAIQPVSFLFSKFAANGEYVTVAHKRFCFQIEVLISSHVLPLKHVMIPARAVFIETIYSRGVCERKVDRLFQRISCHELPNNFNFW